MNGFLSGAPMWRSILKVASDDEIKRPMWDYPPAARKALIHERKRRFGVDDDEGFENG